MKLQLMRIEEKDLPQYKAEMQEAFQLGAEEGGFPTGGQQILPEADIDRSLSTEGVIAYKAVKDGQIVGGAIVVMDEANHYGHLDFLYVKRGIQSKGIGRFIWRELENMHPNIQIWETCTPYFEKRNIHFYVNRCGFHIVEFYNAHNMDPQASLESHHAGSTDEMFRFVKVMNEGLSIYLYEAVKARSYMK